MQCPYCSYNQPNPDDILTHLIQAHRITQANTPPQLQYLWQNRNTGFYEAPNLSGKAPIHQKNAQKTQFSAIFNPSLPHAIIAPIFAPEPWQKISDNTYSITETLIDNPQKKIIIYGKLSPGHGKLIITRKEIIESQTFFGNPKYDTEQSELTILEEYKPFTKDSTYREWAQSFLNRSIEQISLIRGNIFGSEPLSEQGSV